MGNGDIAGGREGRGGTCDDRRGRGDGGGRKDMRDVGKDGVRHISYRSSNVNSDKNGLGTTEMNGNINENRGSNNKKDEKNDIEKEVIMEWEMM